MKGTKRIFTGVLALVLVMVALGATTFAWFSLSTVSQVAGFEGQVQAGEGLELRMGLAVIDGSGDMDYDSISWTSWKSHLNKDDWNEAFIEAGLKVEGDDGEDEADVFRFRALELREDLPADHSALGGTNPFTKLGQTDDGNLYRGKKAISKEDYLEIVFEFRSETAGREVVLSDLKFEENKYVVSNKKIEPQLNTNEDASLLIENDGELGSKITVDAVHALRVSVSTFDKSDYDHNYFSGHEVDKGKGQWDFLEKRGDKIFAEEDSTSKMLVTEIPELGKVLNTTTGSEVSAPLSFDTEVTGGESTYAYAKLVVYIWINGWDPHAFDAIFQSDLGVEFAFDLKEVEPTSTP